LRLADKPLSKRVSFGKCVKSKGPPRYGAFFGKVAFYFFREYVKLLRTGRAHKVAAGSKALDNLAGNVALLVRIKRGQFG